MRVRLFSALWGLFFIGMFLGIRTRYIQMALAALTVWGVYRFLDKDQIQISLRKKLAALGVVSFVLVAMRTITKWLRFDSGMAQYWDFGQYLQATYNLAHFGQPVITFEGFERNYFTIHRSLSVFIQAFLYRVFESPLVLWLWQGVCLVGVAWLICAWVLWATRGWETHYRALMCFFASAMYILSPTFSGQFHWAFNFHVFGLLLMGLGFLFEAQGRWILFFVSLSLAVFESETYALVIVPWTAFQCALRRGKRTRQEAIARMAVLVVARFSIIDFILDGRSINQVNHYFSKWGGSYGELLLSWASDPFAAFQHLSRVAFLKWFAYFAIVSGVWWRSKEIVWRFLSLSPMMVLLGLGTDDWLINIRHHYSLQILVAALAILFLHWLPSQTDHRLAVRRAAVLFFVSSLFVVPNPIRHVYEMVDAHSSTQNLALIDTIQANQNWAVCCSGFECASFSERRYVLPVESCTPSNPLFQKILAENLPVVQVSWEKTIQGDRIPNAVFY